jgi:hypothetical protein
MNAAEKMSMKRVLQMQGAKEVVRTAGEASLGATMPSSNFAGVGVAVVVGVGVGAGTWAL